MHIPIQKLNSYNYFKHDLFNACQYNFFPTAKRIYILREYQVYQKFIIHTSITIFYNIDQYRHTTLGLINQSTIENP